MRRALAHAVLVLVGSSVAAYVVAVSIMVPAFGVAFSAGMALLVVTMWALSEAGR